MQRRAAQIIAFLASATIAFLVLNQNLISAQEKPLELMMARIEENDNLKAKEALYFRKLTPLLFEYLQVSFKETEIEPLYKAQSLRELGSLFEKQFGKHIIEFGDKMFVFFEEKTLKDKSIRNEEWSEWTSEHFVFFVHPESNAEMDIDLIKNSAEEALASLASSLSMEEDLELSLKVVHTASPEKKEKETTKSFPGKIAVFLHQRREGEVRKKISDLSQGATSFGATILEAGDEKGWGRLTAQINIFYFNAFSLAVLNHEVGHAVLFLGSFNPNSLAANPLRGESELKRAFFAGYTPLSPFFHEGMGDYVIYYAGFYRHWPLLPEPEKIIQSFYASPSYIPLKRLVREGRAFRRERHKEYSLEAASFINFLIQTYGKERLEKWFLSGKDSLKKFDMVYERSIEEMEKEWHAYLREKNKEG